MPRFNDLAGKRINHLTVLKRVPDHVTKGGYRKTAYLCRCDCGNEKIILSESLATGNTKACGCLSKTGLKKRKTHGMSNDRNFRIWVAMRQRCSNPRNTYYKNYGGRGITVCKEWEGSYETFRDWSLANGYSDELTIDRIDNNKGYSPDNCRWISRKEQMRNTRLNHFIKANGEMRTIVGWSETKGIPAYVIRNRLIYGWSNEDAVNIPVGEVSNYKSYLRKKRI